MMLERKHQSIAPPKVFIKRMLMHFGTVLILMCGVLFVGVLGYHGLAGLSWVDSLLNASMILGGMGQINTITTDAAKIFASFYALFSGLIVIALTGYLFAPMMHRMLHKFHMDE